MKKPDNIEKEVDAIRKQLQKEREGVSPKEDIEKTNKMARDLSKEFGFKFLSDNKDLNYKISEETIEYHVKENN